MALIKRTSKNGKLPYQVQISAIDPASGRRQNKTIGTLRTKREAEQAERDALTRQERGTVVDPAQTTVAVLPDAWLIAKAGSASPNSLKDYEIAIRRPLVPAFGQPRRNA